MRLMKKCLVAGMTALMLALPIATALPATGITAYADTYNYATLNWSGLQSRYERSLDGDKAETANYTMTVEVGQKFNIGDFATGNFQGRLSDAENFSKSATYKSTKKSVATVTKKGIVTPKKKGTTTMTIKLDDETVQLNLKVVGKKYSNREDVTAIQNDIDSLLKKYPKENSIKVKNSTVAAKKISEINKKLAKFYVENNKVNTLGFYRADGYTRATTDYSNRLVVTNLAQYTDLVETFTNLQSENSAYDVTKAGFSIKSATANFNSSKVKVSLDKKVSATQVFSLISLKDYNQNFKSSMKVEVGAVIVKVDEQGNESYYDRAFSKVKKGTKSFTLTLANDLFEKGSYKVYLTNDSEVYDEDNYTNNVMTKTITPFATFSVQ